MLKRLILGAAISVFATAGAQALVNEDSYLVSQDDRGVISCYQATYYEAKYRVDPKGYRVSGAKKRYSNDGSLYRLSRHPAVYIEKRTRVKEDYVSLRKVPCN